MDSRQHRWTRFAGWGALLILGVLHLLPLAMDWLVRFEPVYAWRKGPFCFEKPLYPPDGTERAVAWALVLCIDMLAIAVLLAARHRRTRHRKPLPGGAVILIQLLVMISFLALMEGVTRWYVRGHLQMPFRPHPLYFWHLQPDLRDYRNPVDDYSITTNRYGLRGPDITIAKPVHVYRILTIGDSATFGHGIEAAETFQCRLEELLRRRYPERGVEVINGACPGWTTYQGVRFYEHFGRRLRPDAVVVAFNNDPTEDLCEEKSRAQRSSLVERLQVGLYRSEFFLLLTKVVARSRPVLSSRMDDAALQDLLAQPLTPRVSSADHRANLERFARLAATDGAALVLVNTPLNRDVIRHIPAHFLH
ncbi:hypothetical protein JW905_19140, partial [bacterium]|nr:hypothetical protein [candidate division CSSED10-310 bacterium]